MDNAHHAALTALKSVVDPEVGLDIVTMGLVYALSVDAEAIRAAISLTTPGCPLGETIFSMAREALEGIAGTRKVSLDLTFEPAWNPRMISDEGRAQLAL